MRVDYSLRRLVHYSGTDWRAVQRWILLTNYQRYVDQFARWALGELADRTARTSNWSSRAAVSCVAAMIRRAGRVVAAAPWHRFQMPAYHLLRPDGEDGVTIVNIGVGPSNAKTSPITSRCCVRIAG